MDLQLAFGIFLVLFLGWSFGEWVVKPYLEHRRNLAFQTRIDELFSWDDEQLRRLYENFLIDKDDPLANSFDEFMQHHKKQAFQAQIELGPDVDVPPGREFAVAAMAYRLTTEIDDPDTKIQMVKSGVDQLDA